MAVVADVLLSAEKVFDNCVCAALAVASGACDAPLRDGKLGVVSVPTGIVADVCVAAAVGVNVA